MPAKLEEVIYDTPPTNSTLKMAAQNIKIFVNDVISDLLSERVRDTTDPVMVGLFNLSHKATELAMTIEQLDAMKLQQERAVIQGQFGRRTGPQIIS